MYFQNRIRWGVIGCGQIAVDKSLPGLLNANGAQLVAVSDPLEARRALALRLAAQQDLQPRVFDSCNNTALQVLAGRVNAE